MALGSPDVRYRLSAEGVKEVVDAFRKVQTESEKSGRGATKAFSGFGSSLASVRGLLGAVSGAIAAIGISRLTSEASKAAEELQNLNLRFSSSVEDLSAISVAARQTGSDMGQLARPLTKLFNDMTDASKDLSGDVADRFRDFGLSTKEISNFAKQDLAGRVETLARAFQKLPEGPERSNVALQLLKDRGAVLIPILDRVGKVGFAGLRSEADRLSSLMSGEVVQSVGAVNDSMDDLRIQSQGLASQFLTGLAPAFTTAIRASTEEVSKGANGWRLFGELVGQVLGFITVSITTMADSVNTRLTTLAANFVSLFRAAAAAATGNFSEAQVHLESIGLRHEREEKLLVERVNRAWDTFFNDQDVHARQRADTNAESLDDLAKKEEASTKARLAAKRAAIDADLALVKAGLKLREQEEEAAFARSETSLAKSYASRRQIVTEGINAEIAALQKQSVLAAADKDKGLAEVQKINGQILVLAKDREEQISALNQKEAAEVKQLAQDRLELDRKVFETRGNQHAASMIAIDEEVRKAGELLTKLGGNELDNQRTLDQLRAALTTAAEFDRISAESGRALSNLGRDRAEIERRAQAGLLSQAEAENQIRDLEQQRIETLHSLADELERAAAASGDPNRISQAKDFAASVDEVSVSLARQGDLLLQLGPGAIDIARQSLEDFLGTGIRTAPTFAAAISGMAASVGASIQQLLGRFIALRIVSSFLGAFGGGIKVPGLANQASDVFTASTGGDVPGSGTGDSVHAVLEPEEFVVRRAVVAQPGVHAFLQALNAGMAHVASAPRGIRHYAEGGLVETGSMSPARWEGLLRIGLDDGAFISKFDGPAGGRMIVRQLARNRRAASRALGGS